MSRASKLLLVAAFALAGPLLLQAQHEPTNRSLSASQLEHVRAIGERLGVPRTLSWGAPSPQSLAVADFDGDGDADIAIGERNTPHVSIFLGDDIRPFASAVTVERDAWPTVDAEIVLGGVGYHAQSGPLLSTAIVQQRSSARRPSGSSHDALALVADFNDDGIVDIAPAPSGTIAMAGADFDADGAIDLVVSDGRSTLVSVSFGDGHGTFPRQTVIDVTTRPVPHGVAAGDLNRDGIGDLVVLGDALVIMFGDGSGGFLAHARVPLARVQPARESVAISSVSATEYEGVASLTLNPSTIAGGSGATSTGTITLNAPAPQGGVVVNLTSSNTDLAASVASVTVPAGASTATFVVGTNKNYRRYSGLAFNVTISATHGATTRSAVLSVTAAPRPGTLSSFDVQNRGNMCFGVGVRRTSTGYELEFGSAGNLFNCVPPPNPVGQDGTCTFRQECALGCQMRAPINGSEFRDVCATTGPFPVEVSPRRLVGGEPGQATLRLAAAAPSNSSGTLSSGTVLANTNPNIPTPIPAGATSATAEVLTARVNSPDFAPIDGSYRTPPPNGSRAGRIGLAWMALTPGTPPPFALTALDFDPPSLTSVVGGTALFIFARMNQVAPAPNVGTATMTVSSSHPNVATVQQPQVTFTQGSSNAGAAIQTNAVSSDTLVTLTATLGNSTRTRQLLVRATPGASAVNSFFLDPLDLVGGESSIGTVVLNGAAPSGGAIVTLENGNPSVVTMPASVTVPAGSDRTSFTITTKPVSQTTHVSLTARFNGTWTITTLTVAPSQGTTAALSAVAVSPSSVAGGSNATGTVTLTAAAPSGGAVVSLSSSNTAAANVPSSVTVPAGATNATFAVTTSAVGGSTPVTISATLNGVTRTASLTVTSGAATATLTVTATGRSGERILSSPAGINVSVGTTGSASFAVGTVITLSVSNGRDAIWSGACSSGSNKTRTCAFTLNGSASVTGNVQ